MSHHGRYDQPEMSEEMNDLFVNLRQRDVADLAENRKAEYSTQSTQEKIDELREELEDKLGPTGRFPDGKINEEDEGKYRRNAMNSKELAALLDGRSYGQEITSDEEAQAKSAGLVVVFGSSDDLMEMRGAINEQIDCYKGRLAYLTSDGLLTNNCDNDDCPYFEKLKKSATPLQAVWDDESDYLWTYKAPFPHETFHILDDGEPYCRGIVFVLSEVTLAPGRDE